eukprot:GHVU01051205.1.p1 GENE.GHVU01051205.1~~GHVU01051205.1.p1  ORF type:complete len:156 (-),score=12.63 GHVU01051205.1:373-840(-)
MRLSLFRMPLTIVSTMMLGVTVVLQLQWLKRHGVQSPLALALALALPTVGETIKPGLTKTAKMLSLSSSSRLHNMVTGDIEAAWRIQPGLCHKFCIMDWNQTSNHGKLKILVRWILRSAVVKLKVCVSEITSNISEVGTRQHVHGGRRKESIFKF